MNFSDTLAFRQWFAASKVVDDQRRPLVVYHGTQCDFTFFDRTEDIGFHFGTAETANQRLRHLRRGYSPRAEGDCILPVFLRIENPLRLRDLFTWEPDDVANKLADQGIITPEEAKRTQIVDRRQVCDWLAAKGYDGIVYQNMGEGLRRLNRDEEPPVEVLRKHDRDDESDTFRAVLCGRTMGTGPDSAAALADARKKMRRAKLLPTDSYIAFRPEQIKSATGNRGTFSPRSASLVA